MFNILIQFHNFHKNSIIFPYIMEFSTSTKTRCSTRNSKLVITRWRQAVSAISRLVVGHQRIVSKPRIPPVRLSRHTPSPASSSFPFLSSTRVRPHSCGMIVCRAERYGVPHIPGSGRGLSLLMAAATWPL